MGSEGVGSYWPFATGRIAREYLARRGSAKFNSEQITPSRGPLLGYAMQALTVEGRMIPRWFLQVNS